MRKFLFMVVLGVMVIGGCSTLSQVHKQSSYTAKGTFGIDQYGNRNGQLNVEAEINSPDRLKTEGIFRKGIKKLF